MIWANFFLMLSRRWRKEWNIMIIAPFPLYSKALMKMLWKKLKRMEFGDHGCRHRQETPKVWLLVYFFPTLSWDVLERVFELFRNHDDLLSVLGLNYKFGVGYTYKQFKVIILHFNDSQINLNSKYWKDFVNSSWKGWKPLSKKSVD